MKVAITVCTTQRDLNLFALDNCPEQTAAFFHHNNGGYTEALPVSMAEGSNREREVNAHCWASSYLKARYSVQLPKMKIITLAFVAVEPKHRPKRASWCLASHGKMQGSRPFRFLRMADRLNDPKDMLKTKPRLPTKYAHVPGTR